MSRRPVDAGAERSRADSRRRVLQVLRAAPKGCGVGQVADRTGLHPNTVRFHLERLEMDGLISRQVRRSGEPGRPPLTYTAIPVPDAGHEHRQFGPLAEVLAQLVARTTSDPAGAAVEAGRSWGLTMVEPATGPTPPADATATLVGTLGAVGFVPEVSVTGEHTTVLQRHCPFLEVAQAHQDVICSVHLGLMRGVLERLNTTVVAERLVPFASPDGCEAYLSSGTAPGSAASD
ncbi:helix-turn-helix domain-containing protein [Georgenia sp. TF02-10]|uniref:helix-turn-helix transcriptional regulator n=1 Tax=Georgenia sp. TF02-10 TaxID=2917725 RepID=UPI001FA7EE8E|nr:helix-turn-helix domain-containing protein [Georgenia sp. TF02-10]UNX54399.1 helix-turn-helix domain-containing protein [Georgenia sp. TF02-10]